MNRIMVRVSPVFFLLLALTSAAWSQSPAPTDNDLDARFSKALGTDTNKVTQHYHLVKNGGVIEFAAKDPSDTATIVAIQKYLNAQKDLFEKGKTDADADAHGRIPDGLPVLKKLRNEITFFAVKNEDGAVLRMFTTNLQARQAIQEFMKFEINEHKTGDPLVAAEE